MPLLAALLCALVLLPGGPALALTPAWARPSAGAPAAASSSTGSSLQEVAPPPPVQQLQAALASRQPVVEILSPRDDTLLPAGPWTLKLRLHDWPLVDGGTLGPGPHLNVQIDQEPPQIWTGLEGTLPPLSPGSHRLTVYAALPWGEAPKTPGAVQQIRLHRTAANPLTLPAPGTPQLLAVSPTETAADGPLLLDWLLLDAPLQNLRGSGSQWRLRVRINGESVLLDQQSPLWLQGWRAGPNALQLDLLDGRGAPLNPPFNSLVLEVNRSAQAPRPRWLGDRLSPQELAVLLGQAPPEPSPPPVPAAAVTASPPMPASAVSPPAEAGGPASAGVTGAPTATASSTVAPAPAPASEAPLRAEPMGAGATAPAPSPKPAPAPAEPRRPIPITPTTPTGEAPVSPSPTITPSAATPASPPAPPMPESHHQPASAGGPAGKPRQASVPETATGTPEPDEHRSTPTDQTATDPGDPGAAGLQAKQAEAPVPGSGGSPGQTVDSDAAQSPSSPPQDPVPAPANPERISAGTAIHGRARDLVNADGTLRQPPARNPLDRLQGWLQR